MNPPPAAGALRVVFAGTPEFAATSLNALLATQHQVVGVYTQPDRPAGRGRALNASPVKQLAQKNGLPIFQPASLKQPEQQQTLAQLQPDVMVVAAYGLLLPQAVLDIPRLGCINVHASLLPRWRGAAPIQRAILAGDRETGITIMQMDAGLDTGAMLLQAPCSLAANETGASLHDRLAALGAQALAQVIADLAAYQARSIAQDSSLATYAHKLSKEEARIDWTQAAAQIERQIRAFNPYPVAFTELGEQRIRIWQASLLSHTHQARPGTILRASAEGIELACGEGVLRLEVVQLPGGRALPVSELLKSRQTLFSPGACCQ